MLSSAVSMGDIVYCDEYVFIYTYAIVVCVGMDLWNVKDATSKAKKTRHVSH